MIRYRDQFRLSVQKIGLRKKRAAFSIISVALGVVIVVTVSSLVRGVRDMIVRTGFTEEIDKDVVKIDAEGRDFAPMFGDDGKERHKRIRFLTNESLAEIRGWKEVEAVGTEHTAMVSVEALAESPRASARGYATGVPEALMRRYADARQMAACTNAIPLLVGERFVKLRYNDRTKKFDLETASRAQSWIGREVTFRVGDLSAQMERFRYDREKKQWLRLSEEELAQRRKEMDAYEEGGFSSPAKVRQAEMRRKAMEAHEGGYDPMLWKRKLLLRARVVGFCPGTRLLIPEQPAKQCEKWLKMRDELSVLNPDTKPEESEYGEYGRRTPREGEYSRGIVLVEAGADAEAVAKRLRNMGFNATTRQGAFESFLKQVDAAMKIVKRIAYAFGGVLLLIACGLLWSTTSRIVSDSRVDIGLFRALGATKSDVRRLFLTETAWLGLIGTIVGTTLGWTAAYWISRGVIHFATKEISDPEETLMIPVSIFGIDWTFCAGLLVGAVLVSLLAGLWPANRAANVDPVKALKRE